MGTSRNDPSADTPPWRRARALLGRPDLPPDQQAIVLWQAAFAERSEALLAELSDPLLARACVLADQRSPVLETLQTFDNALYENHAASVTLDFARRALGRATLTGGGARAFAAELFGELTAYYASRDIPSLLATPDRIRTVSESVRLTHALRTAVQERVSDLGDPSTRPQGWARYVRRALGAVRAPAGRQ